MISAARETILSLLSRARAPRLRTMREFAEQEVVIPEGPYRGMQFRVERQPFFGLLLDEMDSGRWSRFAILGPSQSGKTLAGSVIPCLYHLFEIRETFVYGAPDADMASDKWLQDLRPAIEASRFADLLPSRGSGAKGGFAKALRFPGATLRFLTGGGGDKSRAGFTARALGITEVDGLDVTSEASREADKVSQLEARTNAFGARRRVYLECTVSTETGRIWREYQAGTRSRIALPCPHCGAWVTPEREHLRGWEDAADVTAAKERSALACPACGAFWTEAERIAANARGRLVHHGQEIGPDGEIHGQAPRTDTLGFRWTAANNCLVPMGEVAAEEWRGQRGSDAESAEKKLRQFYWALPHVPTIVDLSNVDAASVSRRSTAHTKGLLPADTTHLTVGIDVGQYLCHWVALAHRSSGQVHVAEYGRLDVASGEMAVERALLAALRGFRDEVCKAGWSVEGASERRAPEQVWIDSAWNVSTDVVYAFCRESGWRTWRPALGHGAGQDRIAYRHPAVRPPPAKAGEQAHRSNTHGVGLRYYFERLPKEGLDRAHVDGDHWKTWIHKRLSTPIGEPGALTLFRATEKEHLAFSHHLTNEKKVEELKGGRVLVRWEMVSRLQHWLDASYLAAAAGHFAGWRLMDEKRKTPAPARTYAAAAEPTTPTPAPEERRERQPYPSAASSERPEGSGGGWRIGR